MLEKQGTASKKTLQYYLEAPSSRKRNYIFNVSKVRTCTHPELVEMVTGAGWYRCTACNWAQFIVTAYGMPLHHMAKLGVQGALAFAKEFGGASLQRVLRTPSGQHNFDFQLPALPENKDLGETVALFDQIDVTAPDGGQQQLVEMYNEYFISPAEKARRLKEWDPKTTQLGKLLKRKGLTAALEGKGNGTSAYERATGQSPAKPELSRRKRVPRLSPSESPSLTSGDQGKP